MSNTHKPEIQNIKVDGYNIVSYSYGKGEHVLFLLNGGPGLPCDYLRDPHIHLVEEGYRIVAFDQLGCGNSDRPEDVSLWNITRYVEEVETVRKELGIVNFHLLGQSWGGWLSIEYALTYPDEIRSLILANTCGDLQHLTTELNRMREALGSETVAMMLHHEAMGTIDHPEYQAAITILNYRHVCRLKEWPSSLLASVDDWNMGPYGTMQGPNEFLYIGNLKDWNRISDMDSLEMPTLIITGTHDEIGPACASRMNNVLPNSEVVVFHNSSHVPFYEEPDLYFKELQIFLSKN
ncbi:MAG TPA: alpha/beta fold hydrolase [Candidatus Marinimicrobia bacterium]|jgi:proline iminopeptidase|nr:proline iminopeptidase [Candidatus Neomarinimicrobiota bacterium]HIA93641.1 alpha/beta fold hydrolase [Gammaproteobacteria bacterium]HIM52987.1 alpha/beta fold hydrolase [Candidatus Neomarinimicrobiota bacterium]|tara:strand:- start:116 stop:994 length:879 start_codon:yes stop_codon:yes gene_type:complete